MSSARINARLLFVVIVLLLALTTSFVDAMSLAGNNKKDNNNDKDGKGKDNGGSSSSSGSAQFDTTASVAAPKVILLCSRNPTDLFWCFQHNNARITLERTNRVVTQFFGDSLLETAPAIIEGAIENGAELVISADFSFAPVVLAAAQRHPNVFFLHMDLVFDFFGQTNIKMYRSAGHEIHYLFGYLSGLFTSTGKIGFVGTIPFPTSFREQAAFFWGTQDGWNDRNQTSLPADELEVYHWYIGGFGLEDLSIASGEDLVDNRGCDIIGHSVGSYGILQLTEDRGVFSMGVVSDMGSFHGAPNSITNGIFEFSFVYLLVHNALRSGTWNSTAQLITGRISDGALRMLPSSPVIPTELDAKLQEKIAFLQDPTSNIFCGERALRLVPGLNNTNATCINQTAIFSLPSDDPDMIHLGTFVIEDEEFSKLSSGTTVGLSVLVGLALAYHLLLALGLFVFRKRAIIFYSTLLFCELIMLGSTLVIVGALVYIPKSTEALCAITVWLVQIGFSILLANLFAKNARLFLFARASEKLQTLKLPNWKLLLYSTVLVAIDVIVLLIWILVEGIATQKSSDGLDKYEFFRECDIGTLGTVLILLLVGFKGVLVALCVIISFYARKVGTVFDESSAIALAAYNIGFSAALLFPVFFISDDTEVQSVVLVVGLTIIATMTVSLLFLPKFWVILRKADGSVPYNEYKIKRNSTLTSFKQNTTGNPPMSYASGTGSQVSPQSTASSQL